MPYDITHLPFFMALPFLLVGSAFFSGSETALFGLKPNQRNALAAGGGVIGHAVSGLMADQSALLVTLMLGNMIMNVLYFVISSALLLQLDAHQTPWALMVVATLLPLLVIIIFGEVLPKLAANIVPMTWIRVVAVPLYGAHRVAAPVERGVGRWVVRPLVRLFSPHRRATHLAADELQALLEDSQRRGVIGTHEHALLEEVIHLSDLRVRDVMLPRVDVVAVDIHQPQSAIAEAVAESRQNKFLVVDGDLDHVAGVLTARRWLLARRTEAHKPLRELISGVRFVPETQRVDRLLEDFRKTGTTLAVVVDEYGGTAGLVTLRDIVERMLGDLDLHEDPDTKPNVERLGPGRWRVSGRLSVHDWTDTFGAARLPPRVATVGGLIMALLGRVPEAGDRVSLDDLDMRVEAVEGGRIESALLELRGPSAPKATAGGPS